MVAGRSSLQSLNAMPLGFLPPDGLARSGSPLSSPLGLGHDRPFVITTTRDRFLSLRSLLHDEGVS